MGLSLSSELAAFVESGISIQIGVADARGRPDGCRCFGVVVAPDRASLTVYAPFPALGELRRCLAENPRVSAVFSRPADHRTIQVKGRLLEARDAGEADREHVERYRALARKQRQMAEAGEGEEDPRRPVEKLSASGSSSCSPSRACGVL